MTILKKLLRSDIRYQCEDNYYQRGKIYFDEGRVVELNIKSEGVLFVQLNSTVKGNASNPYKQNIRIVWRPDYSAAVIDGDCSCPIGYNCKHVAAACFMYQANTEKTTTTTKTNATHCLDWLNSLNEIQQPALPDNHQEFLAYLLKPGKNSYEITVDFLITKHKKSGGLSKGRKTTLSNLRYSYAFLSYTQAEDEEITKLLTALPSQAGLPLITGTIGHLAITKLLNTQRLYWLDGVNAALKFGHKQELPFHWEYSDKAYQLSLKLPQTTFIVLSEPPLYLDTEAGFMGQFKIDTLTGTQLKKILAIPKIPEEFADEFSRRLMIEHPDLPLPTPKPVVITELNNLLPIPVLHLFGQQVGNHYGHFIAVAFRYGDQILNADNSEHYSTIYSENQFLRIQRDLEIEHKTLGYLTELGLTPPLLNLSGNEYLLNFASTSVIETASHWHQFLHTCLPELKNQGWIIEIDSSFHLDFQDAQNFEAEITEGENNWFEMRFNLDINGQSYALLPLIMPVFEHYDIDNLPSLLSIPLGNHKYLNLPSEQLKPIFSILLEMFNSNAQNTEGHLTLSRFNVAALSYLEEQNYGLFTLSGGKKLRELAQKLKNFQGIETVHQPANLNAELRPYQQQGLNWLQFLREYQFGGILADDMGLGKTIQTLSHLLLEKQSGRMSQPSLIIAPTSLMSNWRRETERFTPDLRILTLQGTERKQQFDKINDYDLILTTYPLLSRDEDVLLNHQYHYLILDEAQTIKNPLSKAAQMVRQIKTQHRLCLTGTPMENHLGELWAQFDFLMPGFLGDSALFKRIYRTPIENQGDEKQRQNLAKRVAPFMLRRTKQDVVTELPAKTEIIRSVPLLPKQAALYESIRLTMEKKVREAIAQKGLARSHITILDALLKLRQTCCDPRTLPLVEARKIDSSAKLDLLMEILPEQLEEGRRILVFSQFTRMIALIENELTIRNIAYTKLTGQTKKRDAAIEQFKSGEVNVFLISLKAGGVGLNLTEADTVIIYDPWWNPAAESQAADRAHRIGQDKPVFVYKLITENTVEEKIIAMQDRKRALAAGIYQEDSNEGSLKLTSDDLTALFEPLS